MHKAIGAGIGIGLCTGIAYVDVLVYVVYKLHTYVYSVYAVHVYVHVYMRMQAYIYRYVWLCITLMLHTVHVIISIVGRCFFILFHGQPSKAWRELLCECNACSIRTIP